jgi:hypothetical protein
MLDRRTVGPAIPCQVASPRSLTLFRRTGKECNTEYEKEALLQ